MTLTIFYRGRKRCRRIRLLRLRGFKVDLRMVSDNRKKETEEANAELSRMKAPISKTCMDRTKLLIEAKCILDQFCETSPDYRSMAVPSLQISGKYISNTSECRFLTDWVSMQG